ncbi:MAG: hypothetical protein JRE47_12110 [Deltaproteobacteria bacterium]|nr:hypothetical protein [Deltaproteobacteria bacterium]
MVIIRRRSKQRVAAYKYQRDSRYFVQIAEGIKEAGGPVGRYVASIIML